jgi:hypothetical protein
MAHLNKLRRKWEAVFFILLSVIMSCFYYNVDSGNVYWLSAVTLVACVGLVSVYYRKLALNKEYVFVR